MHILRKGHKTLIHLPTQYAFVKEEWGSFSELTIPQLALSTPFYISHSHMSYRHNPYHLTHVITKYAVQMRHFQNVQWRFTWNPFPRENLPMKFGSCRSSHMIFLQCVSLTHSSNIQTVNHYLIIQSNWSFHNQAMTLVIKFNRKLQFCLLQKLVCFNIIRIPTYNASSWHNLMQTNSD